MAASHGPGYHSPPPIGRSVDRLFEEAQFSGEIYLSGRKLRDYPKLCIKYDLSDTVLVDVSRNRLIEVPHEVCEYLYVTRLNCYHNVIRSIPEAIRQLQNLTHLNLSRNQLSVLSTAVCFLSCLEVLSVSNNKLVSLPEEIGLLKNLMDLDVSCNEVSQLPLQIGDMSSLRCLNVRRNYLIELPVEISRLQLYRLDFANNRIEKIPTVFRKMETLEQLILDHNPLSSPPAHICIKGRQHIMKYLQIEAVKEDRKRGIMINSDSEMKRFIRKSLPPHQSSEEFKSLLGTPESKWKRHTVLSTTDSGYSTADGGEKNGWHNGEELKRQKIENEWKIKHRVQQEEEDERDKEERRRAALRLQEEQKQLMERQDENIRNEELSQQEELKKKEELRLKEERRQEEEECWKREEDIRRLQENVSIQDGVHLRHAGDSQRVESKLIDKNVITDNHYANISPQNYSRPQCPPPLPPTSSSSSRLPQPPSFLPVHGFSGLSSPSSSLSSMSTPSSSSYHMSPPQQQQQHHQEGINHISNENEYRSSLGSHSFKEPRKLIGNTQFRRTASDAQRKPSQLSDPQHNVDNINHVNKNGVTDVSRRSSTSSTPPVSPSPSPRNSVSHLAKPSSPSGSTSQLGKPSSPSGSTSHLAKLMATKSAVPRATNGPAASSASQAVRRTKMATDRSNASSPVTVRPAKTPGTGNLRTQGSALNPVSSNLRRSSNSSATDEDSKPKNGPTTPVEASRPKSRLEEQSKKGLLQISGLKKQSSQESSDASKRISTRPPTNIYGSGRGRPSGPKASEDSTSNFTLRRREEQLREEAEQLDRLRQTIESRLRVTLPDNLSEALRDGVVLCHLANQVRPRSVGSIHVPSPAVPKLTLAKCRRNVDNFLDACRKIGVDQEHICGPQDILDEKGILRVAATITALITAIGSTPKQSAV
ncbi:hypothetical protein BsWGS_09141 [Bradybaena similaris]